MNMKRILIASEHAGFALKQALIPLVRGLGYEADGMGAQSDAPIDYPPIAEAACGRVVSGEYDLGILICGTGIGISIAANKVMGIRAALCREEYSAKMARLHNDANVLCLGSWMTGERLSGEIVNMFLATPFEGGRHVPRVEQIMAIERRQRSDQ